MKMILFGRGENLADARVRIVFGSKQDFDANIADLEHRRMRFCCGRSLPNKRSTNSALNSAAYVGDLFRRNDHRVVWVLERTGVGQVVGTSPDRIAIANGELVVHQARATVVFEDGNSGGLDLGDKRVERLVFGCSRNAHRVFGVTSGTFTDSSAPSSTSPVVSGFRIIVVVVDDQPNIQTPRFLARINLDDRVEANFVKRHIERFLGAVEEVDSHVVEPYAFSSVGPRRA